MREQRTEEIAHHGDALRGQPHNEAIDGLADSGDEFDVESIDMQRESVMNEHIGDGVRLPHRHAWVLASDAASVGAEHVEPDASSAHAQTLDAFVVGLTGHVVGLRNVGGALLLEQIDTAHMINVRLRGDDMVGRPRTNRIEHSLVVRRFVTHAAVHDDAPRVGKHHVRRGGAARAIHKAIDNRIRGIVVGGRQQYFAGPGIDQVIDLLLNVH